MRHQIERERNLVGNLRSAIVLALIALPGLMPARDAKAGATIDLVWNCVNGGVILNGCGSNTILLSSSAASTNVSLDIFLKADETLQLAALLDAPERESF